MAKHSCLQRAPRQKLEVAAFNKDLTQLDGYYSYKKYKEYPNLTATELATSPG
jgi:hypothetical protein